MLSSRWPSFDEEMIEHVAEVLRSGKVNQWTGTKVKEFERKFAEHFGTRYAIAMDNGTTALEVCLRALGVGPGDDVLVTARTFVASASCIKVCGAEPVFVDIDRRSHNVTVQTLSDAVTPRTKAVIVVHLAGWPCEMPEIMEWCRGRSLAVIEDCAQAHGAQYDGRPVGTFGDINAWSFCQDKIMTTGGEGGMVTTDRDDLYRLAWSYKDHGKNQEKIRQNGPANGLFRFVHDRVGTNMRMTEMQASLGIDALARLPGWLAQRRANAEAIHRRLSTCDLLECHWPDGRSQHAFYRYYCLLRPELVDPSSFSEPCENPRDGIVRELVAQGVPCTQGSCGEIYLERAFEGHPAQRARLPVARLVGERSLCLLVDPSYDAQRIELVIDAVLQTLESHRAHRAPARGPIFPGSASPIGKTPHSENRTLPASL